MVEAVVASGQKDVNPKALAASVRDLPVAPSGGSLPALEASMLWMSAVAADGIQPWGTTPKLRDKQLREFVASESYYASAQGVVSARNAAFNWELVGPKSQVAFYKDILENADDGKGWHSLQLKLSQDLYNQDNGAFMETPRVPDSPTGQLVALNHLDSARCWHTGDPLHPVVYQRRNGSFKLLNWWNVVELAEMPTPITRIGFYGLQVCALSRMLRAAQIMRSLTIYKDEKLGGRRSRALHILKGLTRTQINDALQAMRLHADQQGFIRYIDPLIIPTTDPKGDIDIKTIEMSSLPDGFNEGDTAKLYITVVAMAFLEDYQTFAPLPGGNLGTSTQSEVLDRKSQGKGPALYMRLTSHAINNYALPPSVVFRFAEKDLEAELKLAKIRDTRAQTRKSAVEALILTPEAARQQAFEQGDITEEVFKQAGQVSKALTVVEQQEKPPDKLGSTDDTKEQEEQANASPFGGKATNVLGDGARAGPFDDDHRRFERRMIPIMNKVLQRMERKVIARLRKENKRSKEVFVAVKALTDVVTDDEFWTELKDPSVADLGSFPNEAMEQAALNAESLGLAVDFGQVNTAVSKLSETYTNAWWKGLSTATRQQMRASITEFINTGGRFSKLQKNLTPIFGKMRAKKIASTEVTRLFAEGNLAAYKTAGIPEVEWRTVRDAKVDPICDQLAGKRWKTGSAEAPPAHPACRCWLAPVPSKGEDALVNPEAKRFDDPVSGAQWANGRFDNVYLDTGRFSNLERAAAERYKGDSGLMNAIMRRDVSATNKFNASAVQSAPRSNTQLTNAISKSTTPDDVIVYRGVDPRGTTGTDLAEFFQSAADDLEGLILTDDGFISTSLSEEIAGQFAGGGEGGMMILEIHVPKGSNMLWLDGVGAPVELFEAEMLLPAGTQLEITSAVKGGLAKNPNLIIKATASTP